MRAALYARVSTGGGRTLNSGAGATELQPDAPLHHRWRRDRGAAEPAAGAGPARAGDLAPAVWR